MSREHFAHQVAARGMTLSLTRRQRDLLNFIRDYTAREGCGPSYVEMAAGVGLSRGSKALIHEMLAGLEERGHVRRLPGKARSVALVEPPT